MKGCDHDVHEQAIISAGIAAVLLQSEEELIKSEDKERNRVRSSKAYPVAGSSCSSANRDSSRSTTSIGTPLSWP